MGGKPTHSALAGVWLRAEEDDICAALSYVILAKNVFTLYVIGDKPLRGALPSRLVQRCATPDGRGNAVLLAMRHTAQHCLVTEETSDMFKSIQSIIQNVVDSTLFFIAYYHFQLCLFQAYSS